MVLKPKGSVDRRALPNMESEGGVVGKKNGL